MIGFKEEQDKAMRYKIEEALETLIKAEEIKGDKELFSAVQDMAKSKQKAITSIADLKELSAEMDNEDLANRDEEPLDDGEEETDAIQEEDATSNETPDPLLEENGYIKRVERANAESKEPDSVLVTVDKE